MPTTYDVRIWKIDVYNGKRGTTYTVRWATAGKRHRVTFATSALADSFRSDLVTAARKGEAFDIGSGRPISMLRAKDSRSGANSGSVWLPFACDYIDMKWPLAAATYRRSLSEALTAITPAMLAAGRPGEPAGPELRRALHLYAFNTLRRDESPSEVRDVLDWVRRHSLPVRHLAKPDVLRRVLTTIAVRLDGRPAAASVVSKRRRVLYNVAEYAVERGLLDSNPLPSMKGKWKPPRPSVAVDRRSVVNPVQARSLLQAVRGVQRSGPRLVAFFALIYFAALRPEEAANVSKRNLALPAEGWGEIYLEESTPHAGSHWTNDGRPRDRRQLKNRERGEGRTVPCPPELTALLHAHIAQFGTGPDGRLFVGERADELPKLTYMRVWRAARRATFTPEVLAGPLAATPYTLRHACVSTWLNGGVPAPQVAEWAGHSVEMLLRVYAKCIDGQDEALRRRVMEALGYREG